MRAILFLPASQAWQEQGGRVGAFLTDKVREKAAVWVKISGNARSAPQTHSDRAAVCSGDEELTSVLILGSAPYAVQAADWPREAFDHVVVINNAWRIRSDWSHLIYPEDFPEDRRPAKIRPDQYVVTAEDYVPAQNAYGGFVYAGGTMAFTAGYWALHALNPSRLCYFGCDMVYPAAGQTHFYGTGTADPLRDDVTLANLPAKARRLEYFAARQGCAMVNLSTKESVLPYQRRTLDRVSTAQASEFCQADVAEALAQEEALGYLVPSGRYWTEMDRFDAAAIARVDAAWLRCFEPELAMVGS
jgi:hypothetical protein